MATVGQSLKAPETGWKRYDNIDSNILRSGIWSTRDDAQYWNGQIMGTTEIGGYAAFNFIGSKLRIIGHLCRGGGTDISVYIDDIFKGKINQSFTVSVYQALNFAIEGLENTEHAVKLVNNGGGLALDAIDIDENGELLSYSPQVPETPTSGNKLLRVTMIDSSERAYKVTSTEVDAFINWYNKHASTDAASYAINDSVDGSKEYLAFEKIISFKVIPLAQ